MTDEVTEIPDELALNEEYVEGLRYTMMLGIEAAINKYYVVRELIRDLDPEQAVELLNDQKERIQDKIAIKQTAKGA